MPLSPAAQRERREKLRKLGIDPANVTRELPKKNLKRRRCRNCNKFYSVTRDNKKFCCSKCKDEFHKYGSAYGPLKAKLEKLIAETCRAEALKQLEAFAKSEHFTLMIVAAGFDRQAEPSPQLLAETWTDYTRPPKRTRSKRR